MNLAQLELLLGYIDKVSELYNTPSTAFAGGSVNRRNEVEALKRALRDAMYQASGGAIVEGEFTHIGD